MLGASVEEVEFPDVAKPETDSDGDTVFPVKTDSTGAFSENADSDGLPVQDVDSTELLAPLPSTSSSSAGQHADMPNCLSTRAS